MRAKTVLLLLVALSVAPAVAAQDAPAVGEDQGAGADAAEPGGPAGKSKVPPGPAAKGGEDGEDDTQTSGEPADAGAPQISWPPVILALGVCAPPLVGAIVFLSLFLGRVREEPPLIESHWGGFGGGLGGWRISATLAYLILALALSGVFAAVALKSLDALQFPAAGQPARDGTQGDDAD